MPLEHPIKYLKRDSDSGLSITGHLMPERSSFDNHDQFDKALESFRDSFVLWDRSSSPMEYHTFTFSMSNGIEQAPERMYYQVVWQAKESSGKWVPVSDASLYNETRRFAMVSFRLSVEESMIEQLTRPQFELAPESTEAEYEFISALFKIHNHNPGTEGKKLAVAELRKKLPQLIKP